MASYDNTRFRITTWPAQPLPLPTWEWIRGGELIEDDGSEIPGGPPLSLELRKPQPTDPAFGEVYLELAAIDVEDREAVTDLYRNYGVLGIHDETVWRPSSGAGETHGYFGFPGIYGFEEDVAPELDRVRKRLLRKRKLGYYSETFSEFIWGVRCIKDLTTAWQIQSDQLEPNEATWVADCYDSALSDIPENAHPSKVLAAGMRSGLLPFGPTIHDWLDEAGDAPRPGRGGAYMTDRDAALPLFSVLCLELFNHIAEGATYHACANETCGHLFVRQQGGAKQGQHRTRGVMYCTTHCAKAQAQRQYRRRKSEQ